MLFYSTLPATRNPRRHSYHHTFLLSPMQRTVPWWIAARTNAVSLGTLYSSYIHTLSIVVGRMCTRSRGIGSWCGSEGMRWWRRSTVALRAPKDNFKYDPRKYLCCIMFIPFEPTSNPTLHDNPQAWLRSCQVYYVSS